MTQLLPLCVSTRPAISPRVRGQYSTGSVTHPSGSANGEKGSQSPRMQIDNVVTSNGRLGGL
jgi:hypothetical protein